MTSRRSITRGSFAMLDPAHMFDGLFVPTNGASRRELRVQEKKFGDYRISFQGAFQLGVDDQSVLLAIVAQMAIRGGEMTDENLDPELLQKLAIVTRGNLTEADRVTRLRTSLRSLVIDAGYSSIRSTSDVGESLNRLAAAQIRSKNIETGDDQRCNLISVAFNSKTHEAHIAANPRIGRALLSSHQNVQVSLSERNLFEGEITKLLHCWLCSNVDLGKRLGLGNGAHVDTLAGHVWGPQWSSFDNSSKSKKRDRILDAVSEIVEKTTAKFGKEGAWHASMKGKIIQMLRPKKLPPSPEPEAEVIVFPR